MSLDRGYIISDICGRKNLLLKKVDYDSIIASCKNYEELIIKLQTYFPFLSEKFFSYEEIHASLHSNLLSELNEFSDSNILSLEFFIDYYKILNFFKKISKTVTTKLGDFPQLSVIDLCESFQEVEKCCIQNTFLSKYFKNIKVDSMDAGTAGNRCSNISEIYLLVLKNYFEFFYSKSCGFLREIIILEADRHILEICLNLDNSYILKKELGDYFPECNSLSAKQLAELKTGSSLTSQQVSSIFNLSVDTNNPVFEMMKRLSKTYLESFNQHDDFSLIYAYFKLKELQNDNIIWIVKCRHLRMEGKENEIIISN